MNKLVITEDGSHTLYNGRMKEHYHSIHGAIQESTHVFVLAGLRQTKGPVAILEIGFGTGLNALLSLIEADCAERSIHFTAIELLPISVEEASGLNYPDMLEHSREFLNLHTADWGEWQEITSRFSLMKVHDDINLATLDGRYDLVFFDAFSPAAQPCLWTRDVFIKIAALCNPGALLTTYCAKGSVRRTMQSAGFEVERLPGPPGKREMIRARLVRGD